MNTDFLKTTLMNCSGDSFFDHFEKYVNCVIYIKISNILTLNSYTNAYAMSICDEDNIAEIEQFMAHDFNDSMLQDGESIRDYLGIYFQQQQKFKFVSGEKALIRKIAEVCRTLFESMVQSPSPLSQDLLQCSVATNISRVHLPENATGSNELFNIIGAHMITCFNDAKRITLSAWSWPSRYVTSVLAHNYKVGDEPFANLNLQYVTPTNHAKFIDCIVTADLESVREILKNSLAVSLRIDGSTDRTQDHNVYVLANIITADAKMLKLFLGFSTPKSGNVTNYLTSVKNATNKILPWEQLFDLLTSVVTDGESLNTGKLNGLCVKLKELRSNSSRFEVPLLSMWCIGHRVNLAWKSVTKIKIISNLIRSTRKLSTYFRRSGNRTYKLKQVATTNNLRKVLRYPKFFEVRWSEFTYNSFYVTLRNWRASVKYFECLNLKSKMNEWLLFDRIHLLCFLVDVLTLLKAFQKTCQSDSISILDLIEKKNKLMDKLKCCEHGKVLGGWEDLFLTEVTKKGNTTFLHGFKLKKPSLTSNRRIGCSFTVTTRHFIIRKLVGHLNMRFALDDVLQIGLKPLNNINSSTSQQELDMCWSLIVPDFYKTTFYAEYYMAAELLKEYEFKTTLDTLQRLHEICFDNLLSVKYALARVAAALPHSADVERLISIYNKFKTSDRSSLGHAALYNYLYINVNMGCVEKFDPEPATKHWMEQRKRNPHKNPKSRKQNWFNGVFEETGTQHVHTQVIQF